MNTNTFSLDVIIPTFNRPAKLNRSIQSVCDQTIPATRIIVVDNGNNPETREVVESFSVATGAPPVTYLTSPPLSGRLALATGISAATSEWVILLDDDDMLAPKRIEDDARIAQAIGPETVLIQHTFARVDYLSDRIWLHDAVQKELTLANALQLRCFGPPPSVTVRRAIGQKCHRFAEADGWFDYDFWVPLMENGRAVASKSLGYVMDDTRVKKRETTSGTKPCRITLLHYERYRHLASKAGTTKSIVKQSLEREACFFLAKSLGWRAFTSEYRELPMRYPASFVKGCLSQLRHSLFSGLSIPARGSRSLQLADLRKSDPPLANLIENWRITP